MKGFRVYLKAFLGFYLFVVINVCAKDIHCKRINLMKVHGFNNPRDVLLKNDEWKRKLTSLYKGKLIIFDGDRLAGGNREDIAATCKLMINRVVCPTKPKPRKTPLYPLEKSVVILKGKFKKYNFESFYSEIRHLKKGEEKSYFKNMHEEFSNLLHYNYGTGHLKLRKMLPLMDVDYDGLGSSVIFSKVGNHFYMISQKYFLARVNSRASSAEKVCFLDLPWKDWPLYNFDHI